MPVVRFVSAAQMGPAGLNFRVADFFRSSTYLTTQVIFTRYPAKSSGYHASVVHLRV